MQSDFKTISRAGRWSLLGVSLALPVAAEEARNPEAYKQELLAIEKRLDAKLKALDEKLNRLETLESALSERVDMPEKIAPTPEKGGAIARAPEQQLPEDLEPKAPEQQLPENLEPKVPVRIQDRRR